MNTTTHIECTKPNCGFSTEAATKAKARAQMIMHMQREDHAFYLKQFFLCDARNGTYGCTQRHGHEGPHTAKNRWNDPKPSYYFTDNYSPMRIIKAGA